MTETSCGGHWYDDDDTLHLCGLTKGHGPECWCGDCGRSYSETVDER